MINEFDVSDDNIKLLLNNVLMSLKSNNYDLTINGNEIDITSIRLKNDVSFYYFNIIKINKKFFWQKTRFIMNLKIKKSFVHENIDITKNQLIIKEIYDFLIEQEENKNKIKTNTKIESIIDDISSSIDIKYKRDDKITKIINKNK